ncbi:unnamed protein product, partial [Linum tenue]
MRTPIVGNIVSMSRVMKTLLEKKLKMNLDEKLIIQLYTIMVCTILHDQLYFILLSRFLVCLFTDYALVVNVVQKRTRGPTSCMEIHAVEMDERHTITVNEFGQPIGDDKKFSSFLGTVARNNKFAPLNYISWKDVPMEKKEDIWNYVNTKYVVPTTCKKWVLEAVHSAWKGHKSRTKTSMNKYATRR